MADNIIVALVVAIVGSGSLAFLVGNIFARIIEKGLTLFGNHMTEVKGSVDGLTRSIAEHDKHEAQRHERWLETENLRVNTCNDTVRMLLDKDK